MDNRNINRLTFLLATGVLIALASCGKGDSCCNNPFQEQLARLESTQGTQTVAVARQIIDSMAVASPETLPMLVRSLCSELSAKNRKDEAAAIAAYPWGVDASETPEIATRLLTSTLLPGSQAPAIAGLAPAGKQPAFTILLFHESACRTCQGLIWEIGQKYRWLTEMGVRVVTVSTDTNEKAWTEYAATLPWPDKLCDYRGFYSPNMAAWGVAATPTMFLIDGKNKVVDQYGTTDEIWKVIFKE